MYFFYFVCDTKLFFMYFCFFEKVEGIFNVFFLLCDRKLFFMYYCFFEKVQGIFYVFLFLIKSSRYL